MVDLNVVVRSSLACESFIGVSVNEVIHVPSSLTKSHTSCLSIPYQLSKRGLVRPHTSSSTRFINRSHIVDMEDNLCVQATTDSRPPPPPNLTIWLSIRKKSKISRESHPESVPKVTAYYLEGAGPTTLCHVYQA
jgi:hypothetical protein